MSARFRPGAAEREAGLVSIIVALSVSTFVLGFAALAVDMGSAYTRRADLGGIADRLALAGAKGLPDTGAARAQVGQALGEICAEQTLDGVCPGGAPPATDDWMTNGTEDDGEVHFLQDGNGDGRYGPGDALAGGTATALQVVLAPSTLEFGLAAAIGNPSTTIVRSATARVGTPVGAGVLPFALTESDVTDGEFCVRDHDNPPDRLPLPVTVKPQGRWPDNEREPNTNNDNERISFVVNDPYDVADVLVDSVEFEFLIGPDPVGDDGQPRFPVFEPTPQDPLTWRVPFPNSAPGVTEYVWATGQLSNGDSFTTDFLPIRHKRPPNEPPPEQRPPPVLQPGADDLCAQPDADRGFLRVARPSSSGLGALEGNIRTSPQVRLYPTSLLGGTFADCVANVFAPASNCVTSVFNTGVNPNLTFGFFRSQASGSGSAPGRLVGSCTANTRTVNGNPGVDWSNLFAPDRGLTVAGMGGGTALKSRLKGEDVTGSTAARPGEAGWVTSKVLTCPRLAVMPVVADAPVPAGGLLSRGIQRFTYVWIDGDVVGPTTNRGLYFRGSNLIAFTGYVLDPAFLPDVVSGSPRVGPYLGDNMPKEVLLIPDWPGPPP